mmetsp:Transcript_132930/g.231013  ORF Transcript_132930/g.231013 Transcript_132930/m.231013 type:complete len:234 (+) Transcript_132930:202-903(+)
MQLTSMLSARVLSFRSSMSCSKSFCNWVRIAFSSLRWARNSSVARMSCCFWISSLVSTGSRICSLSERCFRHDACVEHNCMGSSMAQICDCVSEMVPFVWSIFCFVSRTSFSNRFFIWDTSETRCSRAAVERAKASLASFAQRDMSRSLFSRNARAASSRPTAFLFMRRASCCRLSSFLLLSSAMAVAPVRWVIIMRGETGFAEEFSEGGPRSVVDCQLRCVVRRQSSSTESA